MGTEPCSQFLHGADLFTGIDGISDTVYAEIRGVEVCVVVKHRVSRNAQTPSPTRGTRKLRIRITLSGITQVRALLITRQSSV